MDPLSDFLTEYGTHKEAAMPEQARHFGRAIATGAAAAAAGSVVAGVGMAAGRAYDALTKGRDFKEMLSFNPDLQEHHDRDPKMFNQMYTSLRGINPQFGKDPLVAGSFMRRMVDQGGNSGGVLTSAVPTGRGNSMMQDMSMIGAQAGGQYYSHLNQAKLRRETDPNADAKSKHELATMEHESAMHPSQHARAVRDARPDPLEELRVHHDRAKMVDYMQGRALAKEDEQLARGQGDFGAVTPVDTFHRDEFDAASAAYVSRGLGMGPGHRRK